MKIIITILISVSATLLISRVLTASDVKQPIDQYETSVLVPDWCRSKVISLIDAGEFPEVAIKLYPIDIVSTWDSSIHTIAIVGSVESGVSQRDQAASKILKACVPRISIYGGASRFDEVAAAVGRMKSGETAIVHVSDNEIRMIERDLRPRSHH